MSKCADEQMCTNISTMELIKLEFSVNIQAKNVFTYFFLIRKCDI